MSFWLETFGKSGQNFQWLSRSRRRSYKTLRKSDSSSGGTSNVPNQVEGIPYNESLGAYTPSLMDLFNKNTQDKRTKLVKLRDEYKANISKLKKEQLNQLFREAQAAGMTNTTTECKTMPKKCSAILEFYVEAFAENDISMKDAPIFNPKKAANDRKRKKRTSRKTTVAPSSAASSSSSSSTSSKKTHHSTADAYKVMGSLTWEYRQTHHLILIGRGRNH